MAQLIAWQGKVFDSTKSELRGAIHLDPAADNLIEKAVRGETTSLARH